MSAMLLNKLIQIGCPVCGKAYIPTYLLGYVRTYLGMYIPSWVCTYVPTWVCMYVPSWVRTYVHLNRFHISKPKTKIAKSPQSDSSSIQHFH